MANGIHGNYSIGDSNRDGMDDDIDRRHGNENESASYSRRYDPRSEQEFTNRMEPQNILQEMADIEAREQARNAMHAAQSDVHFFPDVGKFIIPAENTWAAHAELVADADMRLGFNPEKYFFDKIIDDKLKISALTDKNHPDYAKYEGLRTNLAVLRNDITGMYLDDGGFDKEDEVFIAPMKGIAETLGSALANDVWWKRPFVTYLNNDVAGVEAVGAAEMYKFLLRQQDSSPMLAGFWRGLREMTGAPDKNWGLLPLERSPFSPPALSALPPKIEQMVASPVVNPENAEHRAMDSLALISATNNQFKPVTSLTEPSKAMSVEDGRTILRWLRNLQGVDMDVQDFLSAGTPPEQLAKAEALSNLVRLYTQQMQQSPHMHALPEVKAGSDAAGGAAMMIAEHAMTLVPANGPASALLASAIDSMPEAHFERSTQSVARLLEHMEAGLSRMTSKQIGDRTALDKLLEASERVNQHAKQLQSVDRLTEPKREESVELGREILRKLRGMMFSDKPIEEQMTTGKPEEKAALVEKIDEMVEIYRNLLATALAVNPGLANDPRIKDANDAVGGMTHGIKLMAAKEIPNSMAQTQQIGADATQDPTEWKNMHDRAVGRLLDTMEGGLEAAVDSIEADEQAQEKDADLAQEAVEASLMQSDNSRRKRRKTKQTKTTKQIKKLEKLRMEMTADDRIAGQGRFAAEKTEAEKLAADKTADKKEEKQIAYMGLNANDMAALKSLGSTLRGAGNQAKSLPAADVSASATVSPDDKSATERAIENITSSRRNNNNRRTT